MKSELIPFFSLQASSRLRFNKDGSLLAVTTSDNGVKILSNNDGVHLLRLLETRATDKNRGPSEATNSKVVLCFSFVGLYSVYRCNFI